MIDKDKTEALRKKLQSLKDEDGAPTRSLANLIGLAIGGLLVVAAKMYLFYYVQKIILSRLSYTPFSFVDSFAIYVFILTLIPWKKLWERKRD
jgi:hypothetical protein